MNLGLSVQEFIELLNHPKIDFHQHLSVKQDLEERLAILKRNNIEKAIIIPYDFAGLSEREVYAAAQTLPKTKQYINTVLRRLDLINEMLQDYLKPEDELIFTPWVSPECDNLDSFIEEALMIKIITVLDNFTEDYFERIKPIMSKAEENNTAVMFHTGWGVPVDPLIKLAADYKTKIVIGHAKEDNDQYGVLRGAALSLPNVFLESSYLVHAKRLYQYRKYSDKIFFGSDLRARIDEQTIKGWVLGVIASDLTIQQKKDIMYFNARRFLNY